MSVPVGERHVVVVGGGISGLAAAHRLTESPVPPRVTLLEASPRLGGWIGTTRRDGWVIEQGPDLFLGGKPAAWELCERLGIAGRLHGTSSRARTSYLLGRGRLHRVPEGLTGLVPTRVAPFARTTVLSPLGKARVALEPLVPARRDGEDESVAAFVTRRLGREMYERLVEPLLSGIYAGDGEALSILATFPHFRDNERTHGSLLRAMLAARRGASAPARGFVSFPTGLAELIEAIEARLLERHVELRRSTRARALARRDGGWSVLLDDGEMVDADGVVVALPAAAAAGLVEPHAPDAAAALREIPLVSTATVSLGYREADVPRTLDASGYVIPRAEGRTALACTWSSTKFDGRAPEGHVLFRVFLGGAARPPIAGVADATLVRHARDELAVTMGVRAEPLLVQVDRQADAMPQYVMGHRDRVARVRAALAPIAGLVVTGNALEGVGIPDCVRSAEAAAARVLEGLATIHPDGA